MNHVTPFVLITEGVKANPKFALRALALVLAGWQWQIFLCFWGYQWNWVRSRAQWLELQFLEGDSPDGRSCAMSVLKRIFLKSFYTVGKWGKKKRHLTETGVWWFALQLFLAEAKRKKFLIDPPYCRTVLLLVYNILIRGAFFQDMECLYPPLVLVWGFGIMMCSPELLVVDLHCCR